MDLQSLGASVPPVLLNAESEHDLSRGRSQWCLSLSLVSVQCAKVIPVLLAKGANTEATEIEEHMTALMLAARWGHPDNIAALIAGKVRHLLEVISTSLPEDCEGGTTNLVTSLRFGLRSF
jgi:homoserine kinase